MQTKRISEVIKKLPKPFLTLFAFLLVLIIGDLDFITGSDISISVLYLFPILLIAWYEGGLPAAVISIFSALTWTVADLASGNVYSHIGTAVRNTIIVLFLFLLVTYFITVSKKLLRKRR